MSRAENLVRAGVIGHTIGYALGSPSARHSSRHVGAKEHRLVMELAFKCFSEGLDEKERMQLLLDEVQATETDLLGYYILINFAMKLIDGENPYLAYQKVKQESYIFFPDGARRAYYRILQGEVTAYSRTTICQSGCIPDTIEAALWCFLTTDSFEDAIKKATSLAGGDTCAVSAITGLFAGIYYGIDAIPAEWLDKQAILA